MIDIGRKLVFLYQSGDPPAPWRQAFAECAPELEMRVYPEIGEPADIEVALVFRPPHGVLARLPNLRLIHGKGAGVDHILADPTLPRGIPIVRLVAPSARLLMTQFVIYEILRHHRRMDHYARAQAAGRWSPLSPPDSELTTIGVLGLGVMGMDVAAKLAGLGFRVLGWSASPKKIEGVRCLSGDAALPEVLAASEFLVCLLALTPATEGILSARTLAQLPKGAYVINLARGPHVVDQDLIQALDSGHIAGATLDVFRAEPLPAGHPFWTHPKVTVTPHIAADQVPRTAARRVAENIRRLLAGEPLLDPVDRDRGY